MTAPEPAVGQGSDVALVSQGWKARARSRVQAFGLLISAQLAGERSRFITWVPVLLGLGIAAYFSLPAEPSLAAAVLPALAAGVLWLLSSRAMLARSVATLLLLGGIGFLLAKVRTEWVRAPVLDTPLRSATVTGILERIEPHAKRGHRLTIRVSSISDLEAARTPRRVRVRVMAPVGDIAPGDPLRLKATLSPPAPPPIPGGYDFARAAYYESVGGVGYALKAPERLAKAEDDANWALRVRARIEGIRREISARIAAALPGERGAMATALITGERGGISEATTAAYRDSGLIHILSISGLHMAIMAGAVFASVRLLLAMIPALALRYPIKKWAAFAGIIGAVLYLAVSGGAAATVRAAIMMVVFFGAVMLGRPALALRNVALSALVILVLFPESLLDVGFQMSFAAVVALISGYEALGPHLERTRSSAYAAGRIGQFIAGILLSTLIAGFAVMPFSIYHFHATQHYAALANLVAVPVCNLVVMPAALAAFVAMPFGLERLPLVIMGYGLDGMGAVAERVAALPGAVSKVPAISSAGFVMILAGGLWLTLWQRRWRLAGLPLIVAGIAVTPATTRPDILIGREGAIVAVRAPSGELKVHARRPSTFELTRWLDHEGDLRDPAAVRAARGFSCDALGCHGVSAGQVVAISHHPASLAEDCTRADVLIVDGRAPANCRRPRWIYDRADLKRAGSVFLYADRDTLRVRTVAQERGERPWSATPTPKAANAIALANGPGGPRPKQGVLGALHKSARASEPETGVGRLAAIAAPALEADTRMRRWEELRAEIEDEQF